MKTDYLIVGSGLSALTFGALMANTGKIVQILEAHEHAGVRTVIPTALA